MLRIAIPLCILLIAGPASGQSNNLLKNSNGDDGLQIWHVLGNASVSDCLGTGKCFSIFQDAFIFQDIDVPESATGMFAVLISFASIEPNSGGPLGHPYLYGYFMSSGDLRKATVFSNLNGQEMANPPSASGEWVKQYGVFRIAEKTGKIRIFLRSGCPKTASSLSCVSHFREPGVFLFPGEDEAKAFVSTYQ